MPFWKPLKKYLFSSTSLGVLNSAVGNTFKIKKEIDILQMDWFNFEKIVQVDFFFLSL